MKKIKTFVKHLVSPKLYCKLSYSNRICHQLNRNNKKSSLLKLPKYLIKTKIFNRKF